jgi:hypothetical protein
MRKALMLATALAFIAGPAFASHYPPQTFWNTPDPQAQSSASNQASLYPDGTTAPSSTATTQTGQATTQIGQAPNGADPMDPNQNPHWLRGVH